MKRNFPIQYMFLLLTLLAAHCQLSWASEASPACAYYAPSRDAAQPEEEKVSPFQWMMTAPFLSTVSKDSQHSLRQHFLAGRSMIQPALRLGMKSSRNSPVGSLLRDILSRPSRPLLQTQQQLNNNESPEIPFSQKDSLLPLFGLTHTRGGSSTKTKTKTKSRPKKSSPSEKKESSKKKKQKSDRPCALSATKPFFAPEQIGQLTLTDVGKAFDYATKSTRQGFDKRQYQQSFQQQQQPIVLKLFQAMDQAAATSRGKGGQAAVTGTAAAAAAADPSHNNRQQHGDMDTFQFCAAARLLSEWRLVRQVPEGHKRYASSMKLGHKDVVQNINKMETAAHEYMDAQPQPQQQTPQQLNNNRQSSPSLRDMLQYEIDKEYHPERPKLQEASGAMGLLWVRRQLEFQTTTFQNLLDIPSKISTPAEALAVAYDHVYMNVHKWATQKIFRYTMQEGPEIHEVYQCMNPKRLQAVQAAGVPGESSEALEKRVWEAMEEDAHHHIQAFVKDIQPVLDDLAALFDEFNMNDPKKA